MAPPHKQIEEALIQSTCRVFLASPETTTVNKVRRFVEDAYHLDDGFLSAGDWKQTSKALILDCVQKLVDGWRPDEEGKENSDAKSGTKRQAPDAESPQPKRNKAAPPPAKPAKSVKPAKPAKPTKSAKPAKPTKSAKPAKPDGRPGKKPVAKKAAPPRKSTPKGERGGENRDSEDKGAVTATQQDANSEGDAESSIIDDDSKSSSAVGDTKSSFNVEDTESALDDEEEYPDVTDEAPKRKRKTQDRKHKAAHTPKSTPKKSAAAKASAPDAADEEEIKRLQGQLAKCGVRKLWHNELKQYGGDARAKIRHLKKVLADAGIHGRFSDAKAREIREARELRAEAEAAQEMNQLWGMGGAGRASRSKSKSMKLGESESSDAAGDKKAVDGGGGGDDDDDDDDQDAFAARRRRAQGDLAFLGDDSDSD